MAYTCQVCGAVSHHPEDSRQSYCGRCHRFADERLAPPRWYVLNQRNETVPVDDAAAWAEWMVGVGEVRRHLGLTHLIGPGGTVTVSTVFMGLDLSFLASKPELFETAVFSAATGKQLDLDDISLPLMSSTYAEAEQAHAAVCERFRERLSVGRA